jgi:hypothetical protein
LYPPYPDGSPAFAGPCGAPANKKPGRCRPGFLKLAV